MSNLKQTIKDIKTVSEKSNLQFCLTRFNKEDVSDLDLLVKKNQYKKTIFSFENMGYRSFSHDHALGGRKKNNQKNLVKKNRIKIDLHKDFTWRRKRYIDLKLIWKGLRKKNIEGIEINVPKKEIDSFLVVINIIFEKTYITRDDKSSVEYFLKINNKQKYFEQASKYGWEKSLKKFLAWASGEKRGGKKIKFLPFDLILYSYIQKPDLVSFIYYLFFRIRYLKKKKLPYD